MTFMLSVMLNVIMLCVVMLNVIMLSVIMHEIADDLSTTEDREKMSTGLESLQFKRCFDTYLSKFKRNQFLLNKISHRFIATTK